MGIIVGIDTSCYTTSIAIMNQELKLIKEHRLVLKVPQGKRGLQQSQAVFQHVQNMKTIFQGIKEAIKSENILAIAASTRPRPMKDSYMPVFTVGESQGRVLAEFFGVPFWATSHQEGHLLAGLWSSELDWDADFLAVHLSGGTSELLRVSGAKGEEIFKIDYLGGTLDLHAGQFVDRIGVAMGLPFPAGVHLEKLATASKSQDTYIPSYVSGYNFSFSGGETHALKLIEEGHPFETVARAIENCITKTIEKVALEGIKNTGLNKILLVGGVAANRHLRKKLSLRLEHAAVGGELFFADPYYSTDNAVGTALSGLIARQRGILKRAFTNF
ncbi:MAG: O-sialoglycoprotein endopeptidase [Bacillota bacterium]